MKNGEYILVLATNDYTGKRYRGRYCYEHHLVYWQNTGITPSNEEVIHHIDENKHNNDFSNLELITREKHSSMHSLSRGKMCAVIECPYCKTIFEKELRKTHVIKKGKYTCCSRKCSGFVSNGTSDEYPLDNNILEVYRRFD